MTIRDRMISGSTIGDNGPEQSDSHHGTICILEVQGGTDKGPDGHRRDTIPLCQGFKRMGWYCEPMFYSDDTAEDLELVLMNFDAVLPRVNPGRYEGVTISKLEQMLCSLHDSGVTVFAHPQAMLRMGAKDSLVKIRDLELGKADTYCYKSVEDIWASFPRTLALGERVLKQNRGSQGEGIWVCKIKPGQDNAVQDGRVGENTVLVLQEAVDNHKEEKTMREFIDFCRQYVEYDDGSPGLLVDQQYLPRISEGEIRLNMVMEEPVGIVLKTPVSGGISATLNSGARYEYALPSDNRYAALMQKIAQDIPRIMPALGMDDMKLPLLWTIDVIRDKTDEHGMDTYTVSEFNCSCVGITQQLYLVDTVCEKAINAIKSATTDNSDEDASEVGATDHSDEEEFIAPGGIETGVYPHFSEEGSMQPKTAAIQCN